MKAFRLAVSFLSILPGGLKVEAGKKDFTASVKYFPIVGLLLGLIIAGIFMLASTKLPQQASDTFAIVGLIIFTRALHIDGLADTFDGLLGGRDRDHVLTIMKDSRVGSFGALAIVVVVLLKVVLLSSIPLNLTLKSIIVFPVIGRWAASYAITTQTHARESGLGYLFMDGKDYISLAVSSAIMAAITAILLQKLALVVVIAALLFSILFVYIVRKKIGGITGDTIGALIELTELVVLLILAVL